MKILAMDSSAKSASVAACSDGELMAQYFQNSGLTHSRTLLVMVEDLLKNLELSISDFDLIAVASGPGSFTGVRIGVSAAKGLALGADLPVCGVSTLLAMAHQIHLPDIRLCAVMDARRNQVYNAIFECSAGLPQRLSQDRAISLEELAEELSAYGSQICLIGDGAQISYDFLTKANIPCILASPLLRSQTAYGVALAAMHSDSVDAVDLAPFYLRPSQAERERMARQ